MKQVEEILKESGALLEGHFLLSSGKHSNKYVQCAKVLMYPDKAKEVLTPVVEELKKDGLEIDTVLGPAIGGILVSYEVGRQLDVRSIFSEREENQMTLRRGFSVEKGEKILITEDVITTGKSSLEAISSVEPYGVEIVGIVCLVNRSGLDNLNGIKIYSAADLEIKTFEKDDCPLCKDNVELVKPGSRKILVDD